MTARFCGGFSAPCSLGRRGHLSIQADDGIQVSKTLDTCQDTVENLDTRRKGSWSRKENPPVFNQLRHSPSERAFGSRCACVLACKEARKSENLERLLHRSGVKRSFS